MAPGILLTLQICTDVASQLVSEIESNLPTGSQQRVRAHAQSPAAGPEEGGQIHLSGAAGGNRASFKEKFESTIQTNSHWSS